MFLLNSCLSLFSAALQTLVCKATLIPKLRVHFAEFLSNASSVGLRILSSSTCVGLRYGQYIRYSGFSRQAIRILHYLFFAASSSHALAKGLSPFTRDRLLPRLLSWAIPTACVPTVLIYTGAGISTCCPSATLSGLALGPDFPRADQLYPGSLGYSAWRILTSISLLIPAFSLHSAPLLLIGTVSTPL